MKRTTNARWLIGGLLDKKLRVDRPGCIILYRLNGFLRAFGQDAQDIGAITGATVFVNTAAYGDTPTVGFPVYYEKHIEGRIKELLAAGRLVVIVEPGSDGWAEGKTYEQAP